MVIFFTTLLAVSLVGLMGLIGVRRYELVNNRVIFANIRPRVGAWLGAGVHFFERVAPTFVRHLAAKAYRHSSELVHRGTAWAVIHTEALLERTLQVLRHTTAKEGGGEASAFLREVAEHKKQLQERSGERGAIYEE